MAIEPSIGAQAQGARVRGLTSRGLPESEARRARGSDRRAERRDGGSRVDAGLRVPSYDGDVENGPGIPTGAEELRRRLSESDAFIVSSPEYNGSMPGTLKNLIDWTSRFRPQPFDGKHGLLLSASPSMVGGNGGSGRCACRSSTSARGSTRTCSRSRRRTRRSSRRHRRRRAPSSLREEPPGVPLARRSGEALPVHQARLGRVPRRAARLRRRIAWIRCRHERSARGDTECFRNDKMRDLRHRLSHGARARTRSISGCGKRRVACVRIRTPRPGIHSASPRNKASRASRATRSGDIMIPTRRAS